jgi:hypothetical protein
MGAYLGNIAPPLTAVEPPSSSDGGCTADPPDAGLLL